MAEKICRILFVEDMIDLIDGVLSELECLHPLWILDTAPDIDEAWRMFLQADYHCLVLDVMLPTSQSGVPLNSEGVCLAKWVWGVGEISPPSELAADSPKRKVPIVFLTSRDTTGVQAEVVGIPEGASKPKYFSRLDDVEEVAKTIIELARHFEIKPAMEM